MRMNCLQSGRFIAGQSMPGTKTTPTHCGFLLRAALLTALLMFGCSKEKTIESEKKKEALPQSAIRNEVGKASWYGLGFNGQETASGETFNQEKLIAAHPSLPLGTEAKVTNLENQKKVEVKIVDRGPYKKGRIIDLSKAAAKKLGMTHKGIVKVKVETRKKVKKSRYGNALKMTKKKHMHRSKKQIKFAKKKRGSSLRKH